MKKFEKQIEVRWSDSDLNRHLRHSSYYEYGAHSRIRFFASCGFDTTAMKKANIGPVVFKEECSFIKEIHPDDTITINLLKGEVSEDGSRWVLHHEIFNNNEKSAHITLKGAWIDLNLRKLTIPPKTLADAIHELPPGTPYVYSKNRKPKTE